MSRQRSKKDRDECEHDGINWLGVAITAIGAAVAMGVGYFLGQRAERENIEANAIRAGQSHPQIVELEEEEKICTTSYQPTHVTRTSSTTSTTTTTCDDEDGDDQHLCKICYEQHLNAVILPCRHQIACETCSRALDVCPVCRESITEILPVYRS